MFDSQLTETREVYTTDRLAVMKNVAANGRLFCAMVFVACLAAFIEGYGVRFGRLAVLAAIPVGMACLVDQMKPGRLRIVTALSSYALAAVAAALFLLMIG